MFDGLLLLCEAAVHAELRIHNQQGTRKYSANGAEELHCSVETTVVRRNNGSVVISPATPLFLIGLDCASVDALSTQICACDSLACF